MISQKLLGEIRDRISIVTVIGEHLPLKKAGRNFRGLCPFHQEKTPSFMVNEEKQIFHCFGCGEGGDVFTFLMKVEGLHFGEAVRELAKRTGVALPATQGFANKEQDAAAVHEKEQAISLNQRVQEYFSATLWGPYGKRGRDYLQGRGISTDAAKKYGLGLAQPQWDGLLNVLQQNNVSLPLAARLGLIKRKESGNSYYDFFRDRLMFPIFSTKGEAIGFSGRTLGEDPAKYLNSADSFLYSKSSTLYGLYFAKESIRQQDEAIVVEGNLDAVSLWQAGIQNVVAPLGTALTVEQIRAISRLTRQMVLAFDGDSAGLQAAFRALPLFLSANLVPKAIVMPKGEDPDTFIRTQGVAAWNLLKAKAPELFDFFLATLLQTVPKDTAGKMKGWEMIKPVLEGVTDPVLAGVYRRKVSKLFGFDEEWLLSRKPLINKTAKAVPSVNSFNEEERFLVAALVIRPSLLQNRLPSAFASGNRTQLLKILDELMERFCSGDPIGIESIPDDWDVDLTRFVRSMALGSEEIDWEKVASDCLKKIRTRAMTSELQKLNVAIEQAEHLGDETGLMQLLQQKKMFIKDEVGHGDE